MITINHSAIIQHIPKVSAILYVFMITGVIAASVSGAIRAIESKMDITGAILLAFIAGNAGGTIRDVILGSIPFWVHDQFYIWISLITGLLTYIIIYYQYKIVTSKLLYRILIISDAMGIAAFSLAGVEKALSLNQNSLIAVIMGVWTAIGGGISADIITNRVPLVFSQELYITVAFVGSVLYLLLAGIFGLNQVLSGIIAAFLMIALRLCSVKFKWKLPKHY
jgi:uncharacterized membrane protein YeiH